MRAFWLLFNSEGYEMEKTSAWLKYDEKELKNLEDLSLGYRQFLDRGKRMC